MKKALQTALIAMALAGCAGVPLGEPPSHLFADSRFGPPKVTPTAAHVFELSDAMRAFADGEVKPAVEQHGAYFGLFETLRTRLQLDYDASYTRNAEETFNARGGNCLSLVIMTAAFAKRLDVPVYYQNVAGQSTWTRADGIAFDSGHVNLKVGSREDASRTVFDGSTIDFLQPDGVVGYSSRPVDEATLLAMYLNNRAAETLLDGDLDTAYGWARAAVVQSPAYLPAVNTLGVIYQRHGAAREAERALRYVLLREPVNVHALMNLAVLLERGGRADEAAFWRRRLSEVEPYPPFYFLDQGNLAMQRGDYDAALALYARELHRLPYNDEVHFAIALADFKRGDLRAARKHLAMAEKYSITRDQRDLYGAKLARLKALRSD